MGLSEDLRKRAHEAIKHPDTRKKIQAIASEKNITFNAAMQRFFSGEEQ